MGLDNNADEKHIKCINFDLDTKQLRDIFPDGTGLPYSMIKKFFEDRGFEHRQYSGYISKEPLSEYQIYRIIEELAKKFTWLRKCMQEFDISNAPDRISVKDQIINSALKQEKQNRLKKANKITPNTSTTIKPNTPTTPKPKPRRR